MPPSILDDLVSVDVEPRAIIGLRPESVSTPSFDVDVSSPANVEMVTSIYTWPIAPRAAIVDAFGHYPCNVRREPCDIVEAPILTEKVPVFGEAVFWHCKFAAFITQLLALFNLGVACKKEKLGAGIAKTRRAI